MIVSLVVTMETVFTSPLQSWSTKSELVSLVVFHFQNRNGDWPLLLAAGLGHLEVVKLLHQVSATLVSMVTR